jgi:hypothetical protein
VTKSIVIFIILGQNITSNWESGDNLKKLNLNWSIYTIVKEHPEAIEIMRSLGFEEISKPAMLNTAGRVMTLPKGAALKGIELDTIKKAFIDKDFEIIE